MDNGPTPISEIGKRAKDLLTKGYYGCKDILLSIHGSTPMELIAGLAPGQIFLGNTSVSTRLTFDEVMPHTKAVVSFEVPDPRSGQHFTKSEAQVPKLYILGAIDLLTKGYYGCKDILLSIHGSTPMELIAGLAPGQIFLGNTSVSTRLTFDEVMPHTKAVVSFEVPDPRSGQVIPPNHDLVNGMNDKGETLTAAYVHSIDGSDKNLITADLTHHFSSSENIITLKSAHVIDRYNTVKTKFSSNGNVSMLCQREWRPNSFITVSAEYNIIRPEVSPKWGLVMALNL
ncbi:porin domain, Eukaryotic porin/Tom40 [Artemisia annua]|uniref:Porin domain, Eukaryotic porin/Tom40 n=1 Tax=Artemisia annua TaxID=35608 RepID=A0A2U1MBU9_ARTAN|nr:porin domain, Eukaryotic porin/Tom40 [Artemisia annua]